MPPKVKVTKEEIIAAALETVRQNGAESLNARSLANTLHCSTQPIFSNYKSMTELRQDVISEADKLYENYVAHGMTDPTYPAYKGIGMAYIRFAKEEKELFKLLFMRDRRGENIEDGREELRPLLNILMKNLNLDEEQAYLFHLESWLYVHGIATMFATSYLDWDMEFVSRALTDAFEGLKYRHATK